MFFDTFNSSSGVIYFSLGVFINWFINWLRQHQCHEMRLWEVWWLRSVLSMYTICLLFPVSSRLHNPY